MIEKNKQVSLGTKILDYDTCPHCALAVKVREKYTDDVEVETVYSGLPRFGHKGEAIKPPNIAVNDKILGSEATFEDIEIAVSGGCKARVVVSDAAYQVDYVPGNEFLPRMKKALGE
ncbi:MAG: hypothetical protein HQL08_10515 [Nitrospirae bacterium]|nr:hypothetical protein [Nitrospirota bacterium]